MIFRCAVRGSKNMLKIPDLSLPPCMMATYEHTELPVCIHLLCEQEHSISKLNES